METRILKLWLIPMILLGLSSTAVWAQDCALGTPPQIDVILALEKGAYNGDEAIYGKLSLVNRSNEEVITSKGFMASNFVLMLQIVDEKGQVITSDTLSSITAPTPPPHRVFPVTITDDDGNITESKLIPGDLVEHVPATYKVTFGSFPGDPDWVNEPNWIKENAFNLMDFYPLEGKNGYFTVQAVIAMRTYPVDVLVTTAGGLEYAPLTPSDTANWCGALRSSIFSFTKVGDADGDGYDYPGPDCDDTNAAVHPGAEEVPGDGIDNDCNPATPDVEPTASPGYIQVQADRHVVSTGSHPGSYKEGIRVLLSVFDKSSGSCVATNFGVSWQYYPAIWAGCTRVATGETSADGTGQLPVPPGNYVLIGVWDPDGSLFGASPTYSGDEIYIGRSVGEVESGQIVSKYLQVIEKASGKKVSGKCTKRTGSELLIIEPEYVEWDGSEELYPFIFQSVGDWSVTTSVAPPEGFVADQDSLSAEVNTEIETLQFTITDLGSEWVSTGVEHEVKHKDKVEKIKSKVDVKLSRDLARKKGVDIFGNKIKDKRQW